MMYFPPRKLNFSHDELNYTLTIFNGKFGKEREKLLQLGVDVEQCGVKINDDEPIEWKNLSPDMQNYILQYNSPFASAKLGLPVNDDLFAGVFPPLMYFTEKDFKDGKHVNATHMMGITREDFVSANGALILAFPEKYGPFADYDSNILLGALRWLISGALSPDKESANFSMEQAREYFRKIDLDELIEQKIRSVGTFKLSNIFRDLFNEISEFQLIQYSNMYTKFADACFRIKKSSWDEYYKAMLFDDRLALFSITKKEPHLVNKDYTKKPYYFLQWGLFEDLETLIYRAIEKPDIAPYFKSNEKEIVYEHVIKSVDWIIDKIADIRIKLQPARENRVEGSRFWGRYFVDVYEKFKEHSIVHGKIIYHTSITLDTIDFRQELRNRVKGGEEDEYGNYYINERFGVGTDEKVYRDLEDVFFDFTMPLIDQARVEAILPTLHLGDILPMGHIIDADKACIGNPMIMFANLFSHQLFKYEELKGLKDELRQETLIKYNATLKNPYELVEMESLYQRAQIAISILEIGAHYNRVKPINDALLELNVIDINDRKELELQLKRNLRGMNHYIKLMDIILPQFGEEGQKLYSCLRSYLDSSTIQSYKEKIISDKQSLIVEFISYFQEPVEEINVK